MEHLIKKVGVWIDNSKAQLMEFSEEPFEIEIIESKRTEEPKSTLAQKRQRQVNIKKEKRANYFKKVLNVIANYDEVVLFGPYNVKKEFFILVASDDRFQGTKVLLKQTDKMTPGQQKKAFVRGYFAKS